MTPEDLYVVVLFGGIVIGILLFIIISALGGSK